MPVHDQTIRANAAMALADRPCDGGAIGGGRKLGLLEKQKIVAERVRFDEAHRARGR